MSAKLVSADGWPKVSGVELLYVDPPFSTGRDFGDFMDKFDSHDSYIEWLTRHVQCWYRWLSETGNMVVHIDPRSSHYIKVKLDEIFGRNCFRNEIVWAYNSGGAGKRNLSKKHDILLWYSKSPRNYTFNLMREPYATPNVDGRPGFHPDGRLLTDVWDISFLSTTSSERVGYATQKPLKLLERVVGLFSSPGGLVVDPMCGSGTCLVAAQKLGRRYMGFDINPKAVELSNKRLINKVG